MGSDFNVKSLAIGLWICDEVEVASLRNETTMKPPNFKTKCQSFRSSYKAFELDEGVTKHSNYKKEQQTIWTWKRSNETFAFEEGTTGSSNLEKKRRIFWTWRRNDGSFELKEGMVELSNLKKERRNLRTWRREPSNLEKERQTVCTRRKSHIKFIEGMTEPSN